MNINRQPYAVQITMTISRINVKATNSVTMTFEQDDFAIKAISDFSRTCFEDLKKSVDRRTLASLVN